MKEEEREKVCADLRYFGYGTLCPDEFPCDACRKILKKGEL